jgi:hypothetical protein
LDDRASDVCSISHTLANNPSGLWVGSEADTRWRWIGKRQKILDWPHTTHSISDCLFATKNTILENVQN